MGSIDTQSSILDHAHHAPPSSLPPKLQSHLEHFHNLLDSGDIITPTSPTYTANSMAWSTGKDQHPPIVLRPTTVESLSDIVKYLGGTNLDWKVRSQGFGNASASDVLLSLSSFDDFSFHNDTPGDEHVILGAGGTWRGYYERMEKAAPGWTIVAARTPCIGIGGSTLCSGFSWLSSEFGCVSDPSNLLDAHVMLADGTTKWLANTDPDLMWALRGTETGFAIVMHFKFRARRYEQEGSIWAGPILIPRTQVKEVARGIMGMVEKEKKGELGFKTAMFLYVLRKELLRFIGASDDMLVVHCFCAEGEGKGRRVFEWALRCEGAVDQTRGGMTLWEVSKLQEHIDGLKGTSDMFWTPFALTSEEMSERTIVKSFEWWAAMLEEKTSVAENGYLLFELFSCRDNLSGRDASAWPRPTGYKHMVLVGAGAAADAPKEDVERAKQYVLDAPEKIVGKKMNDVDIVPNALEAFHDIQRVYGPNYDRLRQIKKRVDPENRLKGWFRP